MGWRTEQTQKGRNLTSLGHSPVVGMPGNQGRRYTPRKCSFSKRMNKWMNEFVILDFSHLGIVSQRTSIDRPGGRKRWNSPRTKQQQGRTVSRNNHVQMTCRKCDSSICPRFQGPGSRIRLASWRERVMLSVMLRLPLCLRWPASLLESFFPILALPPDSCRPHPCTGESLWESRLVFLQMCPCPHSASLPLPHALHCSSLASLVCSTRTWRRYSSYSPVIVTNWNGKQDKAPEEKLIMGCLVGRKWIT